MVKFFTEEFFKAIAKELNRDEAFIQLIKDFNASTILACTDREAAYKITARNGVIEVDRASKRSEADFYFAAPYKTWVKIARGGAKIQGEVVGGRVKFKGSMPRMLLYLGRLAWMERKMTELMNKVGTEF